NNIPLGSMIVTAHSGVISNGYKLKPSVNTTAHELGHNQLHGGHTFQVSDTSIYFHTNYRWHEKQDAFSNMHYGPSHSIHLGLQERIKLEYADIEFIDITSISGVTITKELF